jgi:hypothetical protein
VVLNTRAPGARYSGHPLVIVPTVPAETTKEYLFRMLRRLARNDDFNLFISWLKHPVGPENATILEFEAVLVIARAIHKFVAVYGETSQSFIDFDKWAAENANLPRILTDKEKSN